jgi:hypothetical protein
MISTYLKRLPSTHYPSPVLVILAIALASQGCGQSAPGGNSAGGTGGSGGSTSAGGTADRGGVGGTGGQSSTSSTSARGSSVSCTFTQSSSTSTKIATVGIVTWSTTLSGVASAVIDFGLTTSYGFTAPVDLAQASYRTLLLGMKQNKTYHYRITAIAANGDYCTSDDYTIATGSLSSGLPSITTSTKNASALAGGFFITAQYTAAGKSGSPTYILDADNEFVWVYSTSTSNSGAVMDFAGTHMWINANNVPNGTTSVHRVTMDGLTDEDLSGKFSGQNHQLTVLPDETVAFYAYGSNNCDDIKEYSPGTGTVKTIVNSGTAQGGVSACHINDIQYSKDDDTLVFSDLTNQAVVKVKRSDGSTVWILNSSKATFTGDGWKGGQHGIHLLGLDRLLLFNNNSSSNMGAMTPGRTSSAGGDDSGAIAIEFSLDLTKKTISNVWQYKANGITPNVMGDLQRMANGNTVIGYSASGVLYEVDSSGTILQSLTWNKLTTFGYIQKRLSLYGPPPR